MKGKDIHSSMGMITCFMKGALYISIVNDVLLLIIGSLNLIYNKHFVNYYFTTNIVGTKFLLLLYLKHNY